MNSVELLLEKPFFQILGWTLLHFVWQGALVAILLANLHIVLRKRAANLRYVLSCAAMLLMLALPVATFVAGRPAPSILTSQSVTAGIDGGGATRTGAADAVLAAEAANASMPGRAADSPSLLAAALEKGAVARRLSGLLPWMVAVWLTGVLLLSLRVVGGWAWAQRLKRRQTTPAGEAWQRALQNLCARMRVSKPVRLCQSLLVEVPTVIGWLQPVILVPVRALTGLTPPQLEALLAHELAHIRRHDYLVNLLQTVVETLLFYHPAVWWVSHQVRVERENCCDDMAVAACGDVLVYARALAELEHLRMGGDAPALAVAASGAPLVQRIGRLVKLPPPRSHRASPWLSGLITIATVVCLWAAARTDASPTGATTHGSSAPAQVTSTQTSTRAQSRTATDEQRSQTTVTKSVEAEREQSQEGTRESSAEEAETAANIEPVAEDEVGATLDEPGQDKDSGAEKTQDSHEGGGDYIDELAAEGYTKLSLEKIVALRVQGIDRAFIRQMKALGFNNLPVDMLLAMRIHGVSAATVEMMRSAGFDQLSPEELIAVRVHGITPAFIQEIKANVRGNLSLEKLLALRVHGISGDFIESLRAAGFENLTAEQLTAARIHGVTPPFIKAMREAGYANLSLERLTALRIFGVTPEFVRLVRSRGFDDLTVEQLIELKRLGIIKASASK